MFFIDERLKDALKVLVIITPFVFVVVRGRKMIKTDKRLFILIAGFTFVTLGFLSDFVDEFAAFQYVPVFGSAWPFHELIEDIFGVVGFLLFGVGVGAEISYMESLNRENVELIGKLNDSNRKLEKLSQMKSAFVATVSHEIRTSLTTSKLAIENLKDVLGEKLTDTQERIIDALRSSVVRLNGTVEELLDLAKIEAGKMTVKRELFDVCGAIDEVVVLQSSSAKTKNISLTKACKGGLQPIWGDKDKITQVLMNILSNAMKFTPSGGRITVDARAAHEFDGIQVEIADTGPGIAPDRIEKIFNRFESQSESNRSGVGIGLHVSKEIVGLHNGKIWAESELGKGSKFIIQLPMDLRKKRGVKG